MRYTFLILVIVLFACRSKPPIGAKFSTVKKNPYSEYPTHVLIHGHFYPIRNHAKEGLYILYKEPFHKQIKIYLQQNH